MRSKSFTPEQEKRKPSKADGWKNFQDWTQKWNRFFATLFCILAFSLLFAIVVVNVINAERQVADPGDNQKRTQDTPASATTTTEEALVYKLLDHETVGCMNDTNCSFFCFNINCSSVRAQLIALMQEPRRCPSYDLHLEKVDFPNHGMSANEICVRSGVKSLVIADSPLVDIRNGAFNDSSYRNLERLHLVELPLWSIERNAFRGLDHLQELAIVRCSLFVVEYDVMVPVSRSLKTFYLEYNLDPFDLVPFTGNASMLVLEVIRMKGNSLGDSLSSDTFQDLRTLKGLFLTGNRISSLPPGIFDNVGATNTLLTLDLSSNLLTTLPPGIFRPFKSPNTRIFLDQNLWHCDRGLEDLQRLLRDETLGVVFSQTDPKCHSPEEVRGVSVRHVDLQNPGTPSTTPEPSATPPLPTTEPSTVETTSEVMTRPISPTTPESSSDCLLINEEPVCLQESYAIGCNSVRSLGEHYDLQINSSYVVKVASFRIQLKEVSGTSVEISVRNPSQVPYFLMWVQDNKKNSGLISNEQISVRCQSGRREDRYIQHLHDDSLYIFCVMAQDNDEGSPFDCLPYKTRVNAALVKDIWLYKDDQVVAYSLTLLSLVLCCFIGALTMYMIVRRMPTLLKGADRVMIVKENDVMMMRRRAKKKDSTMSFLSFNSSSIESIQSRPLPIPEPSTYLTPTPLKAIYNSPYKSMPRRMSDTSLESSYSYISSKKRETIPVSDSIWYNNPFDIPTSQPPPLPPPLPDRISVVGSPMYQKVVRTPEVEKTECEIYAICEYVKTPLPQRGAQTAIQ